MEGVSLRFFESAKEFTINLATSWCETSSICSSMKYYSLACGRKCIVWSGHVDLWVIKMKKPIILCARSTSRSSEQSKKRRARNKNMRTFCLFYDHNNKILWLSNMADTFLGKFTRCAKVCGLFSSSWLCFRMLIGWADKLWSRGSYYKYRKAKGR